MQGHHSSRRRLFHLAAASAAGLLLGGCGGGDAVGFDSGSGASSAFPNDAESADSAGPPDPVPSVGFAWRITVDQVLVLPAGTSVLVATGAHGMSAKALPALPKGCTLSITSGGDLMMVASAEASELDIRGPWSIEVSSVG